MPPPSLSSAVRFGSFTVTPQVFHRTPHSFALVNLRPLLPGHILVCPHRPEPHLSSLTPAEISDLFLTVQTLQRTLKRVYNATAFNVAVQDGVAAGQSVPHVHCHVIPRRDGDMDDRGGGDAIYEAMEGEEGDVGKHLREAEERRKRFKVDAERKDRSEGEMREEAEMLAREIERDAKEGSQWGGGGGC
ncbi:Bis(5'-nucleosyl)-tetraphosphatase [Elsinoe australis]|uniref:Bis(5'-adenosyl)-triphosphatase n=1 Tax=Elsinoe australis TaxID=40998 RepID=A0A4U7B9G6_9PEZI|nr:Bis(5'-nucleosyl)-tetraphosphatase [Elsinoe australis]